VLRLACGQGQCNYETVTLPRCQVLRHFFKAQQPSSKIKDLPGPVD